jgi:hypothetical protein
MRTVANEAGTCRRYVLPELQAAGWEKFGGAEPICSRANMMAFTTYRPCGRGWTISSSFSTGADKLEFPVHDRCDLEHKGLETVAQVR